MRDWRSALVQAIVMARAGSDETLDVGNAELHRLTTPVSLDKTIGGFSPTTPYRDYAISRDLIHWESQSATRADSETGRRYQNHERLAVHRVRADHVQEAARVHPRMVAAGSD